MYDNFKVANYSNALVSPELYARHLSRLLTGDVIDGFTVVPGTGLQVVLQPGNALIRYGSTNTASARLVSLVDTFNLTISTPDTSNPRIDVVVVYVDNAVALPSGTPTSANLDGPGVAKSIVVPGSPNANPSAPTSSAIQSAVGGSNPYTVVAQVRVDNGVSVIAANKITDVRVLAATSKALALGQSSYVDSGCVWSSLSGLNGAMTAGVVYFNLAGIIVPVSIASVASRGFTASKDTYVSVDITGTVSYNEVSNNASSPTLPANSIWLAIVVTNGSTITSVNQGSIEATAPVISGAPVTVSDSSGIIIYPRSKQDELGARVNTAGFGTGSTSDTLITGLSLTVKGVGSNVEVEAFIPNAQLSTAGNAYLTIYDGATKKVEVSFTFAGTNYTGFLRAIYHAYIPASTSKTYTANVRVSTGSLSINAYQNILKVKRA